MPSDTPILRVSRPVAACQRCRNAKIRCDGKLPACTACERVGKADACLSANGLFAQGRERSYVATLESRVEKLENRINQLKTKNSSNARVCNPGSALAVHGQRTTDNPSYGVNHAAREKEASVIDDLVGDFGLLVVSATARDFYGFTNTVSYARLVMATSIRESLPEEPIPPLPPRREAMILIQHFLNHVFVVLPFFDEASFYASVDAVFHQKYRKATAFDAWCVRMVLAISSALHSKKRWDRRYRESISHLKGALSEAEQVLHPGSIQSIQAMILLVLYSMLDPRHLDSWNLIGMTARIMVDLGIHQDPPRYPPTSRAKLELRRRVFWCVYTLDRSTSIVQTRTFSFSDDSINVVLPFERARLAMDGKASALPGSGTWLQSFDAATHLFRLRQMQSEWYTTLFQSGKTAWADPYQYIWQTYYALNSWWTNIDQSLSSMTKTFFELELNYSYVYILSPSPRLPKTSDYAQKLLFEHCIIYGDIFLRAVTQNAHLESLSISFYDMMRAYMTGRQLVDILVRNRDVILGETLPAATKTPSLPPEVYSELASPPIPSLPSSLSPPPIPVRHTSIPSSSSRSSASNTEVAITTKAITSIDNFTTILTVLGLRFGYLSWRNTFRKEAEPLLAQLRQRASDQQTAIITHNEAILSSDAAAANAVNATWFWSDNIQARDSVGSILLSDNEVIHGTNQNIARQHPPRGIGTSLGQPIGYAPLQTSIEQQYSSLPANRAGVNMPPANEYDWKSSLQGRSQNPHS